MRVAPPSACLVNHTTARSQADRGRRVEDCSAADAQRLNHVHGLLVRRDEAVALRCTALGLVRRVGFAHLGLIVSNACSDSRYHDPDSGHLPARRCPAPGHHVPAMVGTTWPVAHSHDGCAACWRRAPRRGAAPSRTARRADGQARPRHNPRLTERGWAGRSGEVTGPSGTERYRLSSESSTSLCRCASASSCVAWASCQPASVGSTSEAL